MEENISFLKPISSEVTSLFIVLINIISIITIAYASIVGYHTNNVRLISIVVIFSLLAIISYITAIILINTVKSGATETKGFWQRNWTNPSLAFTGFFWLGIGFVALSDKFSQFSFLSIEYNSLFAAIEGQLTPIANFAINTLMVPIQEENFWVITIPLSVLFLMIMAGKKWSLFENKILQLITIIIVSSTTFALFHVGKLVWAFIISAIVFRSFIMIVYWGDMLTNIVFFATVLLAGMYGLHVGNNWGVYGLAATESPRLSSILTEGFKVLLTAGWGIAILVFLGVIHLSALDRVLEFFGIGVDKNG